MIFGKNCDFSKYLLRFIMDKIKLLKERKEAVVSAGKTVREDITALTDSGSFVELSAFSFSKNSFYEEDAFGEGVVTGFATIGGYPFYIVAQNFAVCNGGLSKANCEKIAKTLNCAEKNETPVVYLLSSHGVRVGEGVSVLEGISSLLLKATQLKGTVAQYAVVNGEVYGSSAALASVCDCVFFTEKSVLCTHSPFVLTAKAGKNDAKTAIGGYQAIKESALPALSVSSIQEASNVISQITSLINEPMIDADLNQPVPALNQASGAEEIVKIIENGVELGANCSPEVKTVIGRVGGISVAAIVFNDVRLNALNVKKIKNFAEFACCYGLPLVTFVDCVGIEASIQVNDSSVLKEIAEYLSILDAIDTAKIAVISGKAVGLGYSLFAAKSVGFDYTVAFANAQISLFEKEVGAEIELNASAGQKEEVEKMYLEEASDPFHAAKNGYLDDIIEPKFVKQYLIASLQMMIK